MRAEGRDTGGHGRPPASRHYLPGASLHSPNFQHGSKPGLTETGDLYSTDEPFLWRCQHPGHDRAPSPETSPPGAEQDPGVTVPNPTRSEGALPWGKTTGNPSTAPLRGAARLEHRQPRPGPALGPAPGLLRSRPAPGGMPRP